MQIDVVYQSTLLLVDGAFKAFDSEHFAGSLSLCFSGFELKR